MASCLLSSPRIHSPPDSLMRRTSVTKVSENRVFQQAVKGLDHSERGEPPAILTVPLFFFTREDAAEGQVRPRVKRPLNLLKGFLFEASHFWSQWPEKLYPTVASVFQDGHQASL